MSTLIDSDTVEWNGEWPPPEDWGTWELCEWFNKRLKVQQESLKMANSVALDFSAKLYKLEGKLSSLEIKLASHTHMVPPPIYNPQPPMVTGTAQGV